ncbi:MAG: hypothetical protein ABEI86_04805 [Halobacteriaceae archaeon]
MSFFETTAGVVFVAYIPLLLWGWSAVAGGVKYGILSQHRPLTSQSQANLLVRPIDWLYNATNLGRLLFFEGVLTVAALGNHIYCAIDGRRRWLTLPIGLTVVYVVPLFIKTINYYALHVLPFAAVLSAATITGFIRPD